MAEESKIRLALVTRRSRRGWRLFSRAHRLTTTALAEAMGLWMAEHDEIPEGRLPAVVREWIRMAAAVDDD